MNKTGGKINIFLYIIRRFLRLYPSVLLVLGVMFFLPWLASGPFWSELPGVEVDNCRKSWWANLLFINNWRPVNEMCMQHSWYISADMQLHIIAVFVLLGLYRNVFIGIALGFFLILGGSLAVGIITYVNDYDPTILLSTVNVPQLYRIVEDIHVKTFTYFGPYCIGIGTGYLILKHPKVDLGIGVKLFGWGCAIVLGLSSLYGTHKWNTGKFPSAEITATYAALHRTTFVLALAWVTFMCITGRANTIAHILEFGPFIVMSRLTFMAYLVQGPVIWTRYGSLKERIFYSHFNMLYEYMGNLILSLTIA
ncbi:nose resistant to fluoxetine protein 6, partial [Nephila pilipes]